MLTIKIILRNGLILFGLISAYYGVLWCVRKGSVNLHAFLLSLLPFGIFLGLFVVLRGKRVSEIGVMSFRTQAILVILAAIGWAIALWWLYSH